MRVLERVGPTQLEALTHAIRSGALTTATAPSVAHIVGAATAPSVAHIVGAATAHAAVPELARLLERLGHEGTGLLLEALAAERRAADQAADRRLELVWTGPERDGAGTRDTAVVVRELFRRAQQHVLIAGYAVFGGREIFEELADRMAQLPRLRVCLCLNILPPDEHDVNESQVVTEFGRRFAKYDWPSRVFPALYYYPGAFRALAIGRAVLHAKCVTVDDESAFLTSANFTEAALSRNIEAGVVIHDAVFASRLRLQFESLIASGELRSVPLVHS